MSTRETILAALATTLSGVASGRIYRSRREQLQTLPAVVIEPLSETASEIVLGVLDRRLTVGIAVYAKGDTPDNAADVTLAACWSSLFVTPGIALSDVQIEPSHVIEWDIEDYDYARATLRITVSYRTAIEAM
jgi:hypothetical protein